MLAISEYRRASNHSGRATKMLSHFLCVLLAQSLLRGEAVGGRSGGRRAGTPRSAPMHYLRTHAGQGMADSFPFTFFFLTFSLFLNCFFVSQYQFHRISLFLFQASRCSH